jgi:uncharacterized protein YdeI (YjbR/CyaY-like superfamily)
MTVQMPIDWCTLCRVAKQKTFKAQLVQLRSNLGWTVAYLPFDVEKTWGTRGMLKVKLEIAGNEFRTSLFPTREGKHFVLVNKKMQRAAKIKLGSIAEFRVGPDSEERLAKLPPELEKYFKGNAALRSFYGKMNYSWRHQIGKWISQPKSAGSREHRAEHIAECMLATIEAEAELPPQIRMALERTPNALAGWWRMTGTKRRGELMGIFYYRSPESRARRIQKAVQMAVAAAERGSGR